MSVRGDRRAAASGAAPDVSVIVPMRNEIDHLDSFVEDVAAQDFEGSLELLVADGGSTDGSGERLLELAEAHGLHATVIDNPARIVSPGLNECIRRARGALIVRLDCHTRYPVDYVRRCVEVSRETGAWNVGGTYEARGRTEFERAVACALDSPFGGINWMRNSGERSEADTVYLGAFLPEAFEKAGLFDEALVRNQDDELNVRIRRAGGRIVFDPSITSVYTPRGSYRAVWSQYREYGYWKIAVMRKHRRPATARSLAPAAFVASWALLGVTAPRSRRARRAALLGGAVYALAAAGFANRAVEGRDERRTLVPRVMTVFPCFHAGYGVGMLQGLASWLAGRLRGRT